MFQGLSLERLDLNRVTQGEYRRGLDLIVFFLNRFSHFSYKSDPYNQVEFDLICLHRIITYHLSCSGQNVVIISGEADSGYGALTLVVDESHVVYMQTRGN